MRARFGNEQEYFSLRRSRKRWITVYA